MTDRDDTQTPLKAEPAEVPARPAPQRWGREAQWGRMPQQVFQISPLTRAAQAATPQPGTPQPGSLQPGIARPPVPRPVSAQPGSAQPDPGLSRPLPQTGQSGAIGTGSIFQGSMIPQAAAPRRSVVQTGTSQAQAQVQTASESLGSPTPAPSEPMPPVAGPSAAPVIDATVRPLPPARTPALTVASDLDMPPPPIRQPVVDAPEPVAEPVEAAVPVFARKAARPSRGPLYVGVGVVALLLAGGGVWLMTRPGEPQSPVVVATAAPEAVQPQGIEAPAPTPSASLAPAPVAEAPVAAPLTTPPVTQPVATSRVTTPAPAVIRPAPAATRAPATTEPVRLPLPARTLAQATPTRATTQATPAPVIQTQPLLVTPPAPAPTAARPVQSDPDAPIRTRPQPLD